MFPRTPTILALAVLATGAIAAQSETHTNALSTAGAETSLNDKFNQLDRNDDGMLTRAEAQRDPTIASVYASFDTSATLEAQAKHPDAEGITREQFEAGMQAAASGGVVGAPVSGGETYRIYPDGTIEIVEGTGVNSRRENEN